MSETLAPLNIDPVTLALFREPVRRKVERLEESIMYTRKRLAEDEQSLTAVQNTLNLDDAGMTAHVSGVESARSLAELLIAMGGIDNIKHILSPSSVDMDTRCFDDGVSGLSLIFNDRALVRTKDGVAYLGQLDIRAGSDGTFFIIGHSRSALTNISEAVAHIETMFDVSFNGGAPRVLTVTEVVLPPELLRYEKAIREAISQALPVKDGVAVTVRTKKPRAPKAKPPKVDDE